MPLRPTRRSRRDCTALRRTTSPDRRSRNVTCRLSCAWNVASVRATATRPVRGREQPVGPFRTRLTQMMNLAQPFRQVLMKVLRSAPFKLFADASALQLFIFACCGVSSLSGDAVALPAKQSDMKLLRASPASFRVPASALQDVMRSRCAACAADGAGACAAAGTARATKTEIVRTEARIRRLRRQLPF